MVFHLKERRTCERYDLELPVNIKWKDSFGRIKEESSACKNISSSGVYLGLSNLIKEGGEVDLWIDLSIAGENVKGSLVFALGKVVRNVKEKKTFFGHGIKFTNYRFIRPEY